MNNTKPRAQLDFPAPGRKTQPQLRENLFLPSSAMVWKLLREIPIQDLLYAGEAGFKENTSESQGCSGHNFQFTLSLHFSSCFTLQRTGQLCDQDGKTRYIEFLYSSHSVCAADTWTLQRLNRFYRKTDSLQDPLEKATKPNTISGNSCLVFKSFEFKAKPFWSW